MSTSLELDHRPTDTTHPSDTRTAVPAPATPTTSSSVPPEAPPAPRRRWFARRPRRVPAATDRLTTVLRERERNHQRLLLASGTLHVL